MPTAPDLLEAALVDLLIAAAPFRHGRGMQRQRAILDAAIKLSGKALKAADAAGLKPDNKGLAQLAAVAAEADAEARGRCGYRADLEG